MQPIIFSIVLFFGLSSGFTCEQHLNGSCSGCLANVNVTNNNTPKCKWDIVLDLCFSLNVTLNNSFVTNKEDCPVDCNSSDNSDNPECCSSTDKYCGTIESIMLVIGSVIFSLLSIVLVRFHYYLKYVRLSFYKESDIDDYKPTTCSTLTYLPIMILGCMIPTPLLAFCGATLSFVTSIIIMLWIVIFDFNGISNVLQIIQNRPSDYYSPVQLHSSLSKITYRPFQVALSSKLQLDEEPLFVYQDSSNWQRALYPFILMSIPFILMFLELSIMARLPFFSLIIFPICILPIFSNNGLVITDKSIYILYHSWLYHSFEKFEMDSVKYVVVCTDNGLSSESIGNVLFSKEDDVTIKMRLMMFPGSPIHKDNLPSLMNTLTSLGYNTQTTHKKFQCFYLSPNKRQIILLLSYVVFTVMFVMGYVLGYWRNLISLVIMLPITSSYLFIILGFFFVSFEKYSKVSSDTTSSP